MVEGLWWTRLDSIPQRKRILGARNLYRKRSLLIKAGKEVDRHNLSQSLLQAHNHEQSIQQQQQQPPTTSIEQVFIPTHSSDNPPQARRRAPPSKHLLSQGSSSIRTYTSQHSSPRYDSHPIYPPFPSPLSLDTSNKTEHIYLQEQRHPSLCSKLSVVRCRLDRQARYCNRLCFSRKQTSIGRLLICVRNNLELENARGFSK